MVTASYPLPQWTLQVLLVAKKKKKKKNLPVQET